MKYRSLADFLEDLRESGELLRIDTIIDPCGEAAELTRKAARERGDALLYGSLSGYDLPVVTNLFGTEQRICRALGVASLSELTGRIEQMIGSQGKEGVFARLRGSSAVNHLTSVVPKNVKSAACQQIVRLGGDVDLFQLPLLQSASEEKERTLPSAPLITANPGSHKSLSGRFDFQLLDRQRLAVCWADYDEPALLWKEYRRRNEKMPLAVVLGGEPAFSDFVYFTRPRAPDAAGPRAASSRSLRNV
jgi:4-hydroxy-3-polyprenylbenzoate decarboxylase